MAKKSFADKLREKAQRAELRNKKKDQLKADAKKVSTAKQAAKIAKEIIANLSKKLLEAAKDGQTSLMVLESSGSSYELYREVKSLLCQYANKNGIRWEEG